MCVRVCVQAVCDASVRAYQEIAGLAPVLGHKGVRHSGRQLKWQEGFRLPLLLQTRVEGLVQIAPNNQHKAKAATYHGTADQNPGVVRPFADVVLQEEGGILPICLPGSELDGMGVVEGAERPHLREPAQNRKTQRAR